MGGKGDFTFELIYNVRMTYELLGPNNEVEYYETDENYRNLINEKILLFDKNLLYRRSDIEKISLKAGLSCWDRMKWGQVVLLQEKSNLKKIYYKETVSKYSKPEINKDSKEWKKGLFFSSYRKKVKELEEIFEISNFDKKLLTKIDLNILSEQYNINVGEAFSWELHNILVPVDESKIKLILDDLD